MRVSIVSVAMLALTLGAAQAQSSMKPDDSTKTSPGTVGAMANAPADGVATDPAQVRAQQGKDDRSSPGTVGAAPGTNAPSSNAAH